MMAASGAGDAHAREIAAGLVAAVRGAVAAAGHSAASNPRALAWFAAANVAEDLAGRRKVGEDDAVERDHDYAPPPRGGRRAAWLKSCEDGLACHWRSMPFLV